MVKRRFMSYMAPAFVTRTSVILALSWDDLILYQFSIYLTFRSLICMHLSPIHIQQSQKPLSPKSRLVCKIRKLAWEGLRCIFMTLPGSVRFYSCLSVCCAMLSLSTNETLPLCDCSAAASVSYRET